MLGTLKEFRADYHRHFKKYNDPDEARANPPNLLSQSTLEGSQSLFGDEICDQVLDRRPGYSNGLGWGPKLKSTEKEIELQAKLNEALERTEMPDKNHQALASEVEQMRKLIQDLTRAQQGPPHDP
ncbi:Transposase, Ptta/En/Spm, plant [Cucumis melo var. makuwa]|uniref:Transposase, Ptta/En/Spm, plant n=1 Tax=Cucumis melo var. makuwa TaxID=1194695 RepID=A0A5D3DYP9_CUCMM|nr:Transposase, Ptta/En/Spm, plant [Cucumis melo var. makuwa]TYK28712.1 Transposase, Ptta/En/Spm, plant [Cucumis melo var. makuwa]